MKNANPAFGFGRAIARCGATVPMNNRENFPTVAIWKRITAWVDHGIPAPTPLIGA